MSNINKIGRSKRGPLDRRARTGWIGLAGLTLLVGVIAACSSKGDNADSNGDALAVSGRWALPVDVRAAGAKVRVTYDEAPKWTGPEGCGGALLAGSTVLGEALMDRFPIITSVGGYACRRNTANFFRLSVHGTGRAIDLFVPRSSGAANNTEGDAIANWLVMNAQQIGVQLIIWDRSIWHANGSNDAIYWGPNPHNDHIHVELTVEAAAKKTPWFTDDRDAGVDADAALDVEVADAADAADAPDSTPDPSPPPPPPDPTPANDASVPDAASLAAPPPEDVTSGVSSADDDPGATSSLPDRPAYRRAPVVEPVEPDLSTGCSVSNAHSQEVPVPSLAPLIGVIGLVAWRRRRAARSATVR